MRGVLIALAAWLTLSTPVAARPLVVLLTDATGVEVTDLLAPYAVLAESGAVDVRVVSPDERPVRLMPGVAWVKPQMTLAQLERTPDVIIVPAFMKPRDPERARWLHEQVSRGARVMSICQGAEVLADAGLLDGRQATAHWFHVARLRKTYPKVAWRQDVRWITDGPITSTSGVTASAPASLNLLRELAGEATMLATAARLGLSAPDPRHAGRDFYLTGRSIGVALGNVSRFWAKEDVAITLKPGFDELGFGVMLDGWSLTYRSNAWALAPGGVTSRHGLTILGSATPPKRFARTLEPAGAGAMERTTEQIKAAYGEPTARFVALQLEHPYGAVTAW